MTIKIFQNADQSWAIELGPEIIITGFPEQSDASVWLMEYVFRAASEGKKQELDKQREELRKAMLGAAILAPKTEKDKQ